MRIDPATQAAILALIPGSVPVGTWTVHPVQDSTAACTMLDERIAHLPSGTLPEDRLILIHEEGHILWDLPSDQLLAAFPAVTLPYVAEFYRMLREWVIDARLTAHVEDIRPSTNLKDWSNVSDPSGYPLDAIARQWMQWYYRSLHPAVCQEAKLHVAELWSLIDPKGQQLLTDAYKAIMADLLDDTVSETHAVILAGHFAPPPPPPQSIQAPRDSEASRQARSQAARDANDRERMIEAARAQDQQPHHNRRQAIKDAEQAAVTESVDKSELADEQGRGVNGLSPRGNPLNNTVLKLKVHEHMNMRRSGKRIKDPIGLKQSGAVPTHTEYLRMGGAIFKESPKPSGTILIDCSSSMSWTESELQEAIRIAPNLIVAGYCSALQDHTYVALLCVIARGGRTSVSVPCASDGGNHGSDLPSLAWLAKQPAPRIIVSDGEYWGSGQNYDSVCRAIMKRNKIIRVQSMDAALTWLKGRLTLASPGDNKTPVTPQRRKH